MSPTVAIYLAAALAFVALIVVLAVCPLDDRATRDDPDLTEWVANLPAVRPEDDEPPPGTVPAAEFAWYPAFMDRLDRIERTAW